MRCGDGRARIPRGVAVQADPQALHAEIRGEFHVRVAVADHEAAGLVDVLRPRGIRAPCRVFGLRQSQSSRRKCGQMHTASNSMPCEAEQLQNEPVGALESLLRKARGPQSVLIRDHDEGEARGLELEQRRHDAGHEADLLQAVDLLVRRSLRSRCRRDPGTKSAVRSCRLRPCRAAPTQCSKASFCARVPTETRSERGSAGCARKSRTIRPPARVLAHETIGVAAIDEQKIGIARPNPRHPGRCRETARQVFALRQQCLRAGLARRRAAAGSKARSAASMVGCARE